MVPTLIFNLHTQMSSLCSRVLLAFSILDVFVCLDNSIYVYLVYSLFLVHGIFSQISFILWMDELLHQETLVSDDSPVNTNKCRFHPWCPCGANRNKFRNHRQCLFLSLLFLAPSPGQELLGSVSAEKREALTKDWDASFGPWPGVP